MNISVTQLPALIKRRIADAKIPVIFSEAVRLLKECQTIDDAKYWSDKADALAAWAKIHKSDEASKEAKKLKAYAYRHMGELAEELQPKGCQKPGPAALLRSHGFSEGVAERIRAISKLPQQQFTQSMNRPNPPSVRTLHHEYRMASGTQSMAWNIFAAGNSMGLNASSFRSFCRKHPAKELARGMQGDESSKARIMVREIQDWLDEFEQYLPREGTKRRCAAPQCKNSVFTPIRGSGGKAHKYCSADCAKTARAEHQRDRQRRRRVSTSEK